jgi:hypothetical protein
MPLSLFFALPCGRDCAYTQTPPLAAKTSAEKNNLREVIALKKNTPVSTIAQYFRQGGRGLFLFFS